MTWWWLAKPWVKYFDLTWSLPWLNLANFCEHLTCFWHCMTWLGKNVTWTQLCKYEPFLKTLYLQRNFYLQKPWLITWHVCCKCTQVGVRKCKHRVYTKYVSIIYWWKVKYIYINTLRERCVRKRRRPIGWGWLVLLVFLKEATPLADFRGYYHLSTLISPTHPFFFSSYI